MATLVGVLLVIAAVVLLSVPLALLHGWAFTTLWNWFIPGIFPALPELSVLQGIAMSFTLSALRPREVPKSKEGEALEDFVAVIVKGLIFPFMIVFFGYVLKFWV